MGEELRGEQAAGKIGRLLDRTHVDLWMSGQVAVDRSSAGARRADEKKIGERLPTQATNYQWPVPSGTCQGRSFEPC